MAPKSLTRVTLDRTTQESYALQRYHLQTETKSTFDLHSFSDFTNPTMSEVTDGLDPIDPSSHSDNTLQTEAMTNAVGKEHLSTFENEAVTNTVTTLQLSTMKTETTTHALDPGQFSSQPVSVSVNDIISDGTKTPDPFSIGSRKESFRLSTDRETQGEINTDSFLHNFGTTESPLGGEFFSSESSPPPVARGQGTTRGAELTSSYSSDNLPTFDLVHLLFPGLCALFVAAVVILIACFLTKKKANRWARERPEKSCHTVECDTSSAGIYDVIDEVKVTNSYAVEKARQYDRLRSNCAITSVRPNKNSAMPFPIPQRSTGVGNCRNNNERQPKSSRAPVFASCDKSVKHKEDKGLKRVEIKDVKLGENISVSPHVSSSVEDEERIYETLDKNWKLKTRNLHPDAESLSENKDDSKGRQTRAAELSRMQVKTPGQRVCPGKEDPDYQTMKASPLNGNITTETVGPHEVMKNLPKGSVLCQLRTFEVLDSGGMSPSEHSVCYYYVVNSHSKVPHVEKNPLSFFQNQPIKIVPRTPGDCRVPRNDVTLEPVSNPKMIFDAPSPDISKKFQSPGTKDLKLSKKVRKSESFKTYEKIKPYSSPKRKPIFLPKKSESFRDTSTRPRLVDNNSRITGERVFQRRRSDSCSTGSQTSGVEVPQRLQAFDKSEAARILSKLGPLPPIPVKFQQCPGTVGNSQSSTPQRKFVAAQRAPQSHEKNNGHVEPSVRTPFPSVANASSKEQFTDNMAWKNASSSGHRNDAIVRSYDNERKTQDDFNVTTTPDSQTGTSQTMNSITDRKAFKETQNMNVSELSSNSEASQGRPRHAQEKLNDDGLGPNASGDTSMSFPVAATGLDSVTYIPETGSNPVGDRSLLPAHGHVNMEIVPYISVNDAVTAASIVGRDSYHATDRRRSNSSESDYFILESPGDASGCEDSEGDMST